MSPSEPFQLDGISSHPMNAQTFHWNLLLLGRLPEVPENTARHQTSRLASAVPSASIATLAYSSRHTCTKLSPELDSHLRVCAAGLTILDEAIEHATARKACTIQSLRAPRLCAAGETAWRNVCLESRVYCLSGVVVLTCPRHNGDMAGRVG